MSAQLPPLESQRRHWIAKLTVGVPVHVPRSSVSVSPSRAVPPMVGATVLAGATGSTRPAAPDVAAVDPAALVAVTITRVVVPTSAGVSRYVAAVAPATSVQFAPAVSQRRHW